MNKNSILILAKNINMDRDYINVIDSSVPNIVSLLRNSSHLVSEQDNYSFLNYTENSIIASVDFDTALQANFIAFQNPHYNNKWFFAWIDSVEFNANKSTIIKYTIDAWSTFYNDIAKKDCYVKREHVKDDSIGSNTIAENIDVGQIISDYESNISDGLIAESYYWFVIASNYDPVEKKRYAGIGSYGGYPQASSWYAFSVNINNPSSDIDTISSWIFSVAEDSHAEDIQYCFGLPYGAINAKYIDANHKLLRANKLEIVKSYSKNIFQNFSDYTPKNNKLKVYPYSYARITNNSGSYNDYKVEDFKDITEEVSNMINFEIDGVPCMGYSGKIVPINYQGQSRNIDESIQMGKFPIFSWSSDAFTNWTRISLINLGFDSLNNIYGSVPNLVKNPLKGSVDAVGGITRSLMDFTQEMVNASFAPNTAKGNAGNADVSFAMNDNRFRILHMRPKKEFLQMIDSYFTRYGYAINRIKRPNTDSRPYWNYIEIGSSEEIGTGDVPSQFMTIINGACRRGVTIWHNNENIGNYSLDNSII